MHARTLSSRLRKIMLAAVASPALVACGGTVDNGDGGTDGAAIDTGLPGCQAQAINDGGFPCGTREIQLSGDISKCDLTGDAAGVPTSTCVAICGQGQTFCTFNTSTNVLQCGGACVGRLPACSASLDAEHLSKEPRTVGEYLARAAYLEAAAVGAFAILASELEAHGAPLSLRRAAQRAEADEVRHAREMGALARSHGKAPETPSVTTTEGARPLADIAMENAIEGCVRETYGALLASWQGEHASDLRVRASMSHIARDEARHAALGWRLFEWTNAMLSPDERNRVKHAMDCAIRELEDGARVEPEPEMARALGLPSALQAGALVRAMRRELWS